LVRREQLVPADPPAEAELHLLAGRDPAGLADQLQRQALELGQRLQTQQRDLDRREAEFHARIANIENELRVARLVCAEREYELQQQLVHSDEESPALQTRPAERADRTHPSLINLHRSDTTKEAHQWDQRLGELEESERHLQAQVSQLAYERRKLDDDRKALLEQNQLQQSQMQQAADENKRTVEQELLRLQAWAQELDGRSLAVEQLHADAARMHREAIEMRLCTEQLWSQISSSVSTAEVTKRLSGLRCKLMDQFHLADQRVGDQKAELETLISRLADHCQTLRQQRDELRHWIARRHAEIEADADKLLARERELDAQTADLQRMKSVWSSTRHEYEQKIRRLQRLVNSASA
jgi:hypothetical protein